MPCQRARDKFAIPASAAGAFILPPVGMAVPRVATERANPACPVRGGRDLSCLGSLRFVAHTVEQQDEPKLSGVTEPGQIGAGLAIVGVALGVPILLAGGWPLTMLFGGA